MLDEGLLAVAKHIGPTGWRVNLVRQDVLNVATSRRRHMSDVSYT
jgi:hypothetical protein